MSPVVLFVLFPIAFILTGIGLALLIVTLMRTPPASDIDFDKLDFRLQTLTQLILGGLAFVAGLLLFVAGGLIHVCRLLGRSLVR